MKNSSQLPIMSLLSRRIFAASANSALSERDFSGLGLTLTDRRARLKPTTLEANEMYKSYKKSGISSLQCDVNGNSSAGI